jgi:hypothetical protein
MVLILADGNYHQPTIAEEWKIMAHTFELKLEHKWKSIGNRTDALYTTANTPHGNNCTTAFTAGNSAICRTGNVESGCATANT